VAQSTPFPSRVLALPSIFILGWLFALPGCSPKAHDAVVTSVGNDEITLGEYEKLYIKSNGSREHGENASLEERERFLDLMINYRLKLAEAYDLGMDRGSDVQSEIRVYKGSLAQSFITEREIVSPGVRAFYDRMSVEIRSSHILISLIPDAAADESTAAYNKAYDIITQAKAGADFSMLAQEFSDDPSVNKNKGDLYYFTAGQMVRPFEDAVYAMNVDEISGAPVRTQYGLHIIQVADRRPAPGEVRCSHIMIRFASPTPTPDDTAAAYTRITAIRDSIQQGFDFAELAGRNSEDRGTAFQGGDLGWFTRRRWVPSFDEVALAMQPDEISRVVRTPFGYHIIKCNERRPWKPFEESREEIKTLYMRSRFPDEYQRYLDGLKQELQYTLHDSVFSLFLTSLDSSKTTRDSAWASTVPPALRASTVISLAGQGYSVDSLTSLIDARNDRGGVRLNAQDMYVNLNRITEQLLFAEKAERLERTNPEFASIVREYTEGILLYQIEQENVWEKVVANDSLLQGYFDANRNDFRYPDRVTFTAIRSSTEVGAASIHSMLTSGASFRQIAERDSIRMAAPTVFDATFKKRSSRLNRKTTTALSTIADEMKNDTALRVRILVYPDTSKQKTRNMSVGSRRLRSLQSHLHNKLGIALTRIDTLAQLHASSSINDPDIASLSLTGRRPLVLGEVTTATLSPDTDERAQHADSLAINQVSAPFPFQKNYCIVRLDTRNPARLKTFEEARPEVSTAFQDYESKRVESLWLEKLRTKYPVVKHNEILNNAFAQDQ
jgi:peptidyl-prolyl cis-trans isomerase SurA